MIEVQNLVKTINDKTILNNVSFVLPDNTITVVLGPSGSGKTTLLRCLSRLETITNGSITIDNDDIGNIPNWKMGVVFQGFYLFPHLTILDNLILAPMRVLNLSQDAAETKAMQLLNDFGLADKRDAFPFHLSGGQKQRVAIMRCLMMDPPVLLMDEPTSALDPEIVSDVADMIQSLRQPGRHIFIISHELKLAKMIADDILFFDKGRLLDHMSAQKFFKNTDLSKRAQQYMQMM